MSDKFCTVLSYRDRCPHYEVGGTCGFKNPWCGFTDIATETKPVRGPAKGPGKGRRIKEERG